MNTVFSIWINPIHASKDSFGKFFGLVWFNPL